MIMKGRTMQGYVYLDPSALTTRGLQELVELAIAFVKTLPPKVAGVKRSKSQNARSKA